MLAILGTTRALFLFVDPYSSGENGVEIPRGFQDLFTVYSEYSLSFFDASVLFDPSGFPGSHQD